MPTPEKKPPVVPKQRDRKIICTDEECAAEVELTWEDGEFTGICPGCGINYGRIYTKKFYDSTLAEINRQEEEEKKKVDKKKKGTGNSNNSWW